VAFADWRGDAAPAGPQGSFNTAYWDELIERFALDPPKKVRNHSKDKGQKLRLIAALMSRQTADTG